ncbi:aspartyl protease AED1-like [Cornus florida]|uniref:aspartyl protease AED1-like n=1 Tax=Cornus florida TaxID=4283 RepID=UPI00289D83FA|nr:aspartyl protease AED1-like [Cornus florida]
MTQCNSLKEATLNDPACTYSNECLYAATYGDNSFSSGYLSQDSLTLTESETLPGFVYLCVQDNNGTFGGTAAHSIDNFWIRPWLSAKYGNVFSYCLPTTSGGSGGSLSIGSDSLTGSSYKFTPMLTNSVKNSLYYLSLCAIAVAGRTLGVAETKYRVPTIIDSRTEITCLPIGSLKEMSDVPKVRMVFQGEADLTLAPQNILEDVAEKGSTCLAFAGRPLMIWLLLETIRLDI